MGYGLPATCPSAHMGDTPKRLCTAMCQPKQAALHCTWCKCSSCAFCQANVSSDSPCFISTGSWKPRSRGAERNTSAGCPAEDTQIWSVRQPCVFEEFSPAALCRAVLARAHTNTGRAQIVMVGDSMTHHWYKRLTEVLRTSSVCESVATFYVGSHYLWVDGANYSTNWMPANYDSRPRQLPNGVWSTKAILRNATVLVVNAGAHYVELPVYKEIMWHAAQRGRANSPSSTLRLYRTSTFGNAGCESATRPAATVELAEQLSRTKPYFHGPLFKERNEAAVGIFRHAGWDIMDIYAHSSVRADMRVATHQSMRDQVLCDANSILATHGLSMRWALDVGNKCPGIGKESVDFVDCLHYCSAYHDSWSALLQNLVVEGNKARQGVASGDARGSDGITSLPQASPNGGHRAQSLPRGTVARSGQGKS